MKKKLEIPKEIRQSVAEGAVLAVSISGGKDSQAILKVIKKWHQEEKLKNKLFAIHADLGRAEWDETPEFVEKYTSQLGVELVVVRRERNGKEMDLLDRWIERKEQLEGTGKPFWSSAMARYCTSDLKADPINRYLRQFDNVISIEGIRWEESKARSLKPRWKVRTEIATKGRKALTWNAIIDYSMNDVFATWGQSVELYRKAQLEYRLTGKVPEWWNFHPAYAMGNDRLSCSICILGSLNDRLNGIKHNPKFADAIQALEDETGFEFWGENNGIKKARKRLEERDNIHNKLKHIKQILSK